MTLQIRRFPVSEAFDALARVERALGIAPPPRKTRYHRVGSWLLDGAYLRECLFHPERRERQVGIPAFAGTTRIERWTKLAGDYRPLQRVQAPCAARAICFKMNVRGFYPDGAGEIDRPFTAKLALSRFGSESDFGTEVRARDGLPQIDGLRVPALVHSDLEHDPPFLCEELVFGRRLRPADEAEDVVRALWPFYEKRGIRLAPIRTWIPCEDPAARLAAACRKQGWRPAWGDERAFIETGAALLGSDALAPGVDGHGDLGFSNLMRGADGRIAVLDWADVRPTLVAADLLRVALASSGATAFVSGKLDAAARAAASDDVLSYSGQLAAALLEYILDRSPRSDIDDLAPYFVRAAQLLASPDGLRTRSAPAATQG